MILKASNGPQKLLGLDCLPTILTNIAGRLPENSRNSFVDLQSKKTVKKTDQKNLYIEV